jgi:hypothetical protein
MVKNRHFNIDFSGDTRDITLSLSKLNLYVLISLKGNKQG